MASNGVKDNPEVIQGLSEMDIVRAEKEFLDVVRTYVRTNDPTMLKRAQTAQAMFSAIQRRRGTEGARAALDFHIVRTITRDPEELRRYVEATQPRSPMSLVLAAGQGKAD